ncbi:hypothetical protein Pcinc_044065, partial [Petrolisthes cinctipes]
EGNENGMGYARKRHKWKGEVGETGGTVVVCWEKEEKQDR